MPDDDDEICQTVNIMVKSTILFNKTACFSFIRAQKQNIIVNMLRKDISLETTRSNFSLQITPDYQSNGLISIMVIMFDEPCTIPDELKVWVNSQLIVNEIYDKVVICLLPSMPANVSFELDFSEYINPISQENKTGIAMMGTIFEDGSAAICQSQFSMNATQSLDDIELSPIRIIDISPSVLNTYEPIDILSVTIETFYYTPINNDTFRVILPYDFPSNYFIDSSQLNCSITVLNYNQSPILQIKSPLCNMKGNYIDIPMINENSLPSIDNTTNLYFILNVSGLSASPNYGNSGDFTILIYTLANSNDYKVKGVNLRTVDIYDNPIINQNLNLIKKLETLSQTDDVSAIDIKKGSIKPIYLKPADNKV